MGKQKPDWGRAPVEAEGTRAPIVGSYQTRSVTAEQINARTRERCEFRHFGEVREISTEDRTVELAFSSETPVQRWFGDEVLDHSGGSIRMDRIEGGAALLVNHDWDDQVGVIESVEIGDDKRGRAKVRFGRGARADEIFQDVVDGIRKNVSFGYAVHKVEIEKRKGKADLVRVTDWEPYEISIVSVPADVTVGIGRAQETAPEDQPEQTGEDAGKRAAPKPSTEGQQMKKKHVRNAAGALVLAEVDDNGAIVRELEIVEQPGAERAAGETAAVERVTAILDLARKYGAVDLGEKAIRDGRTVDQFRGDLLQAVSENRGRPLSDGGEQIGMTDKDVRGYSFMRLFRALADPSDTGLRKEAAFEFECAEAAAERAARSPKGVLIPADVLVRAINTSKTGTAAGDTGGYLVATELLSQSYVEMLRDRSVVLQRASKLGGLVGNVDIPAQTGGATGYWLGEDDAATLSAMEHGQIELRPKTAAAMMEVTRRQIMQSSLDMEALMRRDLARTMALTTDRAAVYGTGTSNQPRGVLVTPGINSVTFAAANPTYAELVQMETEIAADNADVDSMSYVVNARLRGHAKTTPKIAGDGAQGFIWETGGTLNGYNADVTNVMADGDVAFGNWSDLLIGMWGGLDVMVDPFTHSARGRIRIVTMQDVDVAVRRAASFCVGRDA